MIQLQAHMNRDLSRWLNSTGDTLESLFLIAILGFIVLIVLITLLAISKRKDRRESRESKESYDILVRPKYRYLGGVCEAIGRKNNIAPIWIRSLFIVTVFFLPSFFVYIILCFAIKSYKNIDLKT